VFPLEQYSRNQHSFSGIHYSLASFALSEDLGSFYGGEVVETRFSKLAGLRQCLGDSDVIFIALKVDQVCLDQGAVDAFVTKVFFDVKNVFCTVVLKRKAFKNSALISIFLF